LLGSHRSKRRLDVIFAVSGARLKSWEEQGLTNAWQRGLAGAKETASAGLKKEALGKTIMAAKKEKRD